MQHVSKDSIVSVLRSLIQNQPESITLDEIDEIVDNEEAKTGDNPLTTTGLSYLWNKIKTKLTQLFDKADDLQSDIDTLQDETDGKFEQTIKVYDDAYSPEISNDTPEYWVNMGNVIRKYLHHYNGIIQSTVCHVGPDYLVNQILISDYRALEVDDKPNKIYIRVGKYVKNFENEWHMNYSNSGSYYGWVEVLTPDSTIKKNMLSSELQSELNNMDSKISNLSGIVGDNSTALFNSIWKKIYPVGSVYISYNSTSPQTLFGGKWVQLTGRFLRMANDVNTGGSDTVSHSHGLSAGYGQMSIKNTGEVYYRYKNISGSWSSNYSDGNDGASASSASFNDGMALGGTTDAWSSTGNNMPAYQDLYAWRRTE